MDLVWLAVVAGFLVEALLYYVAPGWLARLAFVPIAETAWSTVQARGPLPPPSPLPEDDLAVGRWEGERGWLRLKYQWGSFHGRWQAVARLDAHRRGPQVALEAKMWPVGIVGLVVAIPVLALHFAPKIGVGGVAIVLGVVALVSGISFYVGRGRLEDSVVCALHDIARRLR